MSKPLSFTTTLISKTQLTNNVFELRLEKPQGFSYAAGQFLQCIVPDGESHCLRSYSLSSKPSEDCLELCVKILPEGKASSLFKKMRVGDTLDCKGPFGRFSTKGDEQSTVFIATGVGLAPIAGIIDDELRTKKNTMPIHLLFGVRNESDIFWLERLETLDRDFENFSYTLSLSKPSATWDAEKGRVTQHLSNSDVAAHYFICGSPNMVKDVRTILLEQKVSPAKIHFEIF